MKLQRQIKTAAALAFSALAVAGPAAAGTPLDGYRDGPERHSALTSAEAAVVYFRANEHSSLAQPSGEAAIKYFHENERATAATSGDAAITYFYANERSQGPVVSEALIGYVDGPERGALLRSTTPVSVGPGSDDGGFDWGAAAVGATSVFMFGLLIGGSLLTVRHLRGGPLTH